MCNFTLHKSAHLLICTVYCLPMRINSDSDIKIPNHLSPGYYLNFRGLLNHSVKNEYCCHLWGYKVEWMLHDTIRKDMTLSVIFNSESKRVSRLWARNFTVTHIHLRIKLLELLSLKKFETKVYHLHHVPSTTPGVLLVGSTRPFP